jgi:HEAT repeat protein
MRTAALAILLSSLALSAAGCGKKPAPAPAPEDQPAAKQHPAPPDPAAERNKLLAGLKSNKQETRNYSIEELSWVAEDDPAVLPALVEMLKDRGTAGPGRTLANQVNSTREAAAMAIMLCTNGEKVMKEKGLPVLREGLKDPSPAVREHTAYTVGLIGAVAKPLAPDVQKLCTDKDANVRGVAFDTLRIIGVADPVALVKLLGSKEEDIVRLTAELIPLVKEMPAEAVPPLVEALGSDNANVRLAAAAGLAEAGPKAAPAADALAEAIKKSYPAEFDPAEARLDGPESVYWKALAAIGGPAVAPTAKLLDHKNVLVRALAARTLGEMGEPAKAAKDALAKALNDQTINVAVEAAVALCALNESVQASIDLMKRGIDAPNDAVAGYAIQGIPRMGARGKELVPLALSKMGGPNPNTRLAAVWLVGEIAPAEATKAAADVGKRATDEVPEVRRYAGRVLAQLGPAGSPAAEALGKALATEKELDIRDQFIEALIAMKEGAKPALPGLLPLVADKALDAVLRAKVVAAVVVADPSSPEVASALVKAANDPDVTARAAIATALGKLNPLPADALAALVKLAKTDPKTAVRAAAIQAMATAGPRAKGAKPDLEAISAGQMAGLALWAKVALAAVDGDVKKAAPTIRAGLTQRVGVARNAAAEALLLIGPTAADLPALLKLLRDGNSATRTAAAQNVARLGPVAKDAVPALTKMLDDRDFEARVAAAEALGAIGPAALPAVRKLRELRADPLAKATAQKALDRIEKK